MDESCSNVDVDDNDDNNNNHAMSSSSSSSSSSHHAHPCCIGAAIVVTVVISASIGAIGMALFLWRNNRRCRDRRERRKRRKRKRKRHHQHQRRRRQRRREEDDDDDDGGDCNRRDGRSGSGRSGRSGRSDNENNDNDIDIDERNSSLDSGQRRFQQPQQQQKQQRQRQQQRQYDNSSHDDDDNATSSPHASETNRNRDFVRATDVVVSSSTSTSMHSSPSMSHRRREHRQEQDASSAVASSSASHQRPSTTSMLQPQPPRPQPSRPQPSRPQQSIPLQSNNSNNNGTGGNNNNNGNGDEGHGMDRDDEASSLDEVSGDMPRRNSQMTAGPDRNPRNDCQDHRNHVRQHHPHHHPQQQQQQQQQDGQYPQQQQHQQQGDNENETWEFQPDSIQPKQRRRSSSSQFACRNNANAKNANNDNDDNSRLQRRNRSPGSLAGNPSSSAARLLGAGGSDNFDGSMMSVLRDSFTVGNIDDHDDGDADNNGNTNNNENDRQFSNETRGLRDSVTTVGSCYDDATIPNNNNHHHDDPQNTMEPPPLRRHASEPPSATTVDAYISETEFMFKGNRAAFSNTYTSVSHDLPDSLRLLRRTRAVSALSNRLMAAPDEARCLDEVARLLVLMFRVERVSFAMLTGREHFLLRRVTRVGRKEESDARTSRASASSASSASSSAAASSASFDLACLDSDRKRPLRGTAAGACVASRREHYTPRTSESPFDTHRVFHRNGINTVLVSPILVNGNRCAGCIMLCREEEDGFRKAERVLVGDIGLLLGANVYAKRLLREAVESRKRSREMLHSFIPPKVFDKIECYWDTNSDEFKSRKSSANSSLSSGSANSRDSNGNAKTHPSSSRSSSNASSKLTRTNSWYVAQTAGWSDAEIGNNNNAASAEKTASSSVEGIKEKIQLIKNMNRSDTEVEDDSKVVILSSTPGGMADFAPTSHALYAENVSDVCIVFTDIVGFSSIAMDISPRSVMDMLQDLFSRFDDLCDVHGVLKLETIGDAYICCTNLMEEDDDDDEDGGVQDAAARALAMAKDMVIEATNVRIPVRKRGGGGGDDDATTLGETLQIRVGIHVGDVTCGVLGQRLPKFTTCGTAVNMAARMEQTSQPGRIRVTKDFHDAVGDAEKGWSEEEVIPLKNMGSMRTYMLNPMRGRS